MAFTLEEVNTIVDSIDAIVNRDLTFQNDELRRRLRDAGRKLNLAMESTGDTLHRISYEPMQFALAHVGNNIHLFEILTESKSGLTKEELASVTNVDVALIRRLLMYYQSVGMVRQVEEDHFAPTNITKALASNGGQSGLKFHFDVVAPTIMAFPRLLQDNKYVNPTDPTHTAFKIGMKTSLNIFEWLQSHPKDSVNFNTWMTSQRESRPNFLDVIDSKREFGPGLDGSTVLFVDIGGSKGHQSIALRRRYPDLPGRIIVQDLPHVIAEVKQNPLPGSELIELQAHDMFSPQTVKGARVYYFRQVLHDWTNDKCKEILRNIKPAMSESSIVIIDEMVISDRNAPWRATQADFTMAVLLSAMQRTEAEWRSLLDDAGFTVLRIVMYREELQDCMIVATSK